MSVSTNPFFNGGRDCEIKGEKKYFTCKRAIQMYCQQKTFLLHDFKKLLVSNGAEVWVGLGSLTFLGTK